MSIRPGRRGVGERVEIAGRAGEPRGEVADARVDGREDEAAIGCDAGDAPQAERRFVERRAVAARMGRPDEASGDVVGPTVVRAPKEGRVAGRRPGTP